MVRNLPGRWETQVQSLGWEDCWRRKWQLTSVFLPGKSHGQRSLVGYSPWGQRVRHDWVTNTFTFYITTVSARVLVTRLCPTLCNPMDCSPPGFFSSWDFPGKNTGVGSHSFLQGIFPIQESNPGLPNWRQILYCLSHQGSSIEPQYYH